MILELGKLLGAAAEQLRFLIPGNERQSLFREMFCEVRDLFVSSNEFGLSGYLSTGLRHGTLAGQLRAPFETYQLVTQRDEETKIYRDPSFWLDRYSTLPKAILLAMSERLQAFSRRVDELIDVARTEWIQVHTEAKPTGGLFDYTISDVRLAQLQQSVDGKTLYDDFLNAVFDLLWEITERSLRRVREQIDSCLKPLLMQEVDSLEHDIRAVFLTRDASEILASITKARTSAQYAVDKIASWFKRAKESDLEPYGLDLPIEIAIEMVKTFSPPFTSLIRCMRIAE